MTWSTSDGWPVSVMHIYFWHDGHFWVSCMPERKRVAALRARPQSSFTIAFEHEQTVTAKTLATVHEHGSPHHDWFYRALARKVLPTLPASVRALGEDAWVARIDSPGRVVIEFDPQKWISFDGRKVGAHAEGRWLPGDPWIEPDESGPAV